jgi:hypothetical protein
MTTIGRRAFLAGAALLSPFVRAAGAGQPPSLDDFLAMSSRLTGHSDLDREVGAAILQTIVRLPDGASRLARRDAALEREIVAAWYTGICAIGGERRLVTHTAALQWRVLGMPAPGTCTGRFGGWSQPPRTVVR